MPNFKDPKAFSDSEDSQAVAEAKKIVIEPTEYAYTEVRAGHSCLNCYDAVLNQNLN